MDDTPSPDRFVVGAGALAPIVVAIFLVTLQNLVDNTVIALALVVVVVAAGALGGRLPGAVAAVTAAVAFNFFHTRPYLSLRIASAEDVETMSLLLVIGLIVGQVAAVAHRRAAEARSGREDVDRVWRAAEAAVSGADASAVLTTVRKELQALLCLQACWWDSHRGPSTLPVLQPRGVLEPLRVHRFAEHDFELPARGFDIPVRADGRVLGYFRCIPTAGVGVGLSRRRAAVVLADAAGLTLRPKGPADIGSPNPGA